MPRRVNRIHATKQQLLALKFGETDRDTTMGHSPLIPQPQRSCSRQTGAIVFRHYDEGRNPFEPFDEPLAISTAKDEDHSDQSADPQPNGTSKHHPKPPRVDAKQITLKRIMARARAPPPTVLSARQAREEVNRETRKEFIRTHSALLKHSNIVESAKVDELVRTVMALNSIDAALENGSMPSSRSLLPSKSMRKSFMMPTGNLKALRSDDALANSTTAKSQPMSTRATKDADKYRFSLETVKSLYREFEALNIDHVFLNCFSTGAPVLFGTNVVTLAQLKAASDVNLDIRFDTLLRIVRSDVPESYYATVMEQWKAYREDMKTSTTASFRDKFDLATVRDIERVWSILIDSLKDEPQYVTAQPPHDRGITIEQFVAYVENMRSLLTAEDAAALFEKHSVPGGLPASKHLGASPSLPPIASFAPGAGRARGIGRRPNKVVISDEVASEVNSPLLGAIKYQSFSGVSNASDDVQSTKGPSLMLITDARPVMTIQGFAMTVAQH